MTTYKTGNPLGSAAVKDLFDNAENLDHFENDRSNETWENRFGVPGKTRYGMEQEHDRQISSQEARFQQFLLSSGYVFLGDYLDGPFQFSARNQYIRYNNQYYRLNAATDVGFTTTGTDATSFANDVTHFVLMDGDTLRQNLSSSDGASLIGGLGFLTPEMFSENITLDDDFSFALHRTIEAAKNGPVKLIILGSLYKISSSFDIPDGVTIRGGGPETGVYLEKAPAEPMHIIFNMACVGSRLENFGVYFNTGGQGSISAVQVYGVFLQANSKDCTINGLTINGKPGDTVMGFSNGIRCTGAGNKILFCDIQYCSMGITARGDKHQITRNYCNNHFVDENLSAWSSSSPYWDGITAEGLSNSLIADNICEYNGQSGIYIGGNNSLSYDNIISRNTIRYNFNRGIDIGVSGTPSETNGVNGIQASVNFSKDNRTVDLWFYASSDAVIVNNVCKKTSEYETIFGAYSLKENRQALAAAGFNCNILGNRLYTTKNDNFSYSASGTNTIFDDTNFINDGASGYIREVLFAQKFKNYKGVTTPVLRAGSNNVTLISSSAAYTIDDNSIIYEIDLHLTASGGNGNLYIGTFNPLNGLLLEKQSVEVTYVSGMNNNFLPGSELFAYFLADDPAQLCIARRYGSDIISDIPACIGTGTRIRLIAKATVNTTTKTNDATGISLFGHSFLSEQGFANGVSESLGLRA
ncbi:TPA: right-handed parallel beta-helix repeat-containing protein, partial [Klebsiella pneumoniae]|nr:right-handed parallel beta-helix repeat-containing protein [Klebsiella pneumoniae]